MSAAIDPNTPLLVTMPARQWNSLLAAANEGLQALSAVMAEAQRQCMQQSMRPPDDASLAERIPAQRFQRRNGEEIAP